MLRFGVLCFLFLLANNSKAYHFCRFYEGETVALAKITSLDSRYELNIELLDVISTNDLKKGDELKIYYHVWNDLNFKVGDTGVFRLNKEKKNWHAEHVRYPDEGNKCTFETNYFEAKVDLNTLFEGVKYFKKAITFKPKPENTYYRADTAVVLVEDSLLNAYITENAYFRYLFYHLDFFNHISEPPNYGFWPYYQSRHAEFVQREKDKGNIRFVKSGPNLKNSNHPSFYLHFQELSADSLIQSEYILFYNLKKDTIQNIYQYKHKVPAKNGVTLDLMGSFDFSEASRFDFQLPGYNSLENFNNTFIRSNHISEGEFFYVSHNQDTIFGNLVNGEFEGEITVLRQGFAYQMNFNNGIKHGTWQVKDIEHDTLLFVCTYHQGYRAGNYHSCNREGKLMQTGTYTRGVKTGEWREYYGRDNQLISIKNYGSLLMQITDGIEEELGRPPLELLSYYGVDQTDLGLLYGLYYYFDYDGDTITKQNWNGDELLSREDWYRFYLCPNDSVSVGSSHVLADTVIKGGVEMIVYHTKGTYRDNKPFSGTFLVGGRGHPGMPTVHGRMPEIKVFVAKYENGECLQTELIHYEPGNNIFQHIEVPKKKKWRLFKRRK